MTIIRKDFKFLYDEHVARLLSIPEAHLKKIIHNRGLPIIKILEEFNIDTVTELNRYGKELEDIIITLLTKLNITDISKSDKQTILLLTDEFCKADLYKNRFNIMLESIERKVASYGISFDIKQYRVDIVQASSDAGAENLTRKIKAKIENELSCYVNNDSPEHLEAKEPRIYRIVRKIWHDPVWSKVIATMILASAGLIWASLHHKDKQLQGATIQHFYSSAERHPTSKTGVEIQGHHTN